MNLSIEKYADVWGDLVLALHGKASHGHEAEIYGYRLVDEVAEPWAEHPELWPKAAAHLWNILAAFIAKFDRCIVLVNEVPFNEYSSLLPIDWRVGVRVMHESDIRHAHEEYQQAASHYKQLKAIWREATGEDWNSGAEVDAITPNDALETRPTFLGPRFGKKPDDRTEDAVTLTTTVQLDLPQGDIEVLQKAVDIAGQWADSTYQGTITTSDRERLRQLVKRLAQ